MKPFFERMSLAGFLKTGDNYKLAWNVTFDVLARSGTCVFMPGRAEKAQSGDLKQGENYPSEPSCLLFIAACTLCPGLFHLLA